MRLSRKVLDAYNAAIKKQGDNAENAARKALEAWFEENPTATVADAREFSIALMDEVGSFFGNAAGDIAYALRDMTAEAAGVELEPVDYEYAPESEYVSKAAHYQAGKLRTGDRPGFVDGIASSSRYFAERGANDTMTALGEADGKRLGKRVRFARVPTGATNCPFCIMLASRGFVYKSELSALNANHPHCDCRIVEGFDGMEVEGYDQDYYLDCYEHPDDHPEVRDAINARRRELYAESAKSERKAARKMATLEEAERRRIENLSDEAKTVFGSKDFVDTFGTAAASRTESAIDNAIKSGDRRRANAAKLLARDIEDGFEVESVTARGSKFIPSTGRVQFSPDGAQSARTIAHELAHRRDWRSALSYIAKKITQGGMADVTLTTPAGDWSTLSFEHGNKTLAARFRANGKGVTPAWKALKKRLGAKSDDEAKAKLVQLRREAGLSTSDVESLSDIVHAASNGEVSLGYGHRYKTDADGNVIRDARGNPVPYWDDTTRIIETWADYSASLVSNGREAQLIQQLFPEECAIMDAMMEVMV